MHKSPNRLVQHLIDSFKVSLNLWELFICHLIVIDFVIHLIYAL